MWNCGESPSAVSGQSAEYGRALFKQFFLDTVAKEVPQKCVHKIGKMQDVIYVVVRNVSYYTVNSIATRTRLLPVKGFNLVLVFSARVADICNSAFSFICL